jgi:hypothetical protein
MSNNSILRDSNARFLRLEEMVRKLRLARGDDIEILDLTDYLDDGWDANGSVLVRVGHVVYGAGVVLWDPGPTVADAAVTNPQHRPDYDAHNLISSTGNQVGINLPKETRAAGTILPENFRPIFGLPVLTTNSERAGFADAFVYRSYVGADGYWTSWDTTPPATGGNWIPGPGPVDTDARTHLLWPTYDQTATAMSIEGIMWLAGGFFDDDNP